jgi:DegV family protein with EDD domain
MALLVLNANMFHGAVIQACHWVIKQRESLNAINIFPVADGDTGDNMAATAAAIINHAPTQATLSAVCKVIADASILGARGNSGMIFSQFFNGLIEDSELPSELNTQQFASMINKAAKSVRAAILNPVEGTILTVMDAWAKSLSQHSQSINDFKILMQEIKKDVQTALQSTTNILTVLKEAHVVDAGAKGFSLFVQGFAAFLSNPQSKTLQTQELSQTVIFESHHHDDLSICGTPNQRYCTEAVIMSDYIDKELVKERIRAHGDSVVITGNQRLCRLHLHCTKPAEVFDKLRQIGKVRYPKVDDMLRQYQVIHDRKYPIALVTDSGANIPANIADDYQIHFISFNVHIEDHDLLDKHSFDSNDFYNNLANLTMQPTTSFPSPTQIEEKINYLARHYDEVLVISLAQVLSGTHDAIKQISARYSNVHVINSRHVAGSQGLLLNYAAELIDQGLDIAAIKEAVLNKIPKIKFFVMLNHIDSMVRSGRVHKIAGKIVQFTGIKPIITFNEDGRVILCDKAFSEEKAQAKLIKRVKSLLNHNQKIQSYCILHAGVPEKAKEFAKLTTEIFKLEPAFIEPAATAVGLHAGNGSLALAVMFR